MCSAYLLRIYFNSCVIFVIYGFMQYNEIETQDDVQGKHLIWYDFRFDGKTFSERVCIGAVRLINAMARWTIWRKLYFWKLCFNMQMNMQHDRWRVMF